MKILILDSSRFQCDAVAKALESQLICEFLKGSTPLDGIKFLKEHQDIKLILSDYYLNTGNGGQILAFLSKHELNIPFIWLTDAKRTENDIAKSFDSFDLLWYIQKPCKNEALVFIAKNALEVARNQAKAADPSDSDQSDSEARQRTKKLLEQLKKQKEQQTESESLRAKKEKAGRVESVMASLEERSKKQTETTKSGTKQIEEPIVKTGLDKTIAWDQPVPSPYPEDEDPNTAKFELCHTLKLSDNFEEDLLKSFMESGPEKFTASLSEAELASLILKAEIFDSQDYVNEKLSRFSAFNMLACSLYLRLSRTKMVKIVNANEIYDSDLLKNYRSKNIEYLYIKDKEYSHFRELYNNYLRSNLRVKGVQKAPKVLELILPKKQLNKLHQIGITKPNLELGNRLIHECLALARSSPQAIEQLNKAYSANPFIYEHSLMLVYVCIQMAINTQLDASTTLQKLVLASLFHDVVMDDFDWAHLHDLEGIEAKKLSSHQRREYRKHCQKAADLMLEARDLHPDVDDILLQHHERPDGKGFPWKVSADKIHPLSAFFIIAEDFIHQLYFTELEELNIKTLLDKLAKKYSVGRYNYPLDGLLSF